jgi:dTDP-4-amino-4,6-dideoxygalactose transaminase
MKSYQIPFSPPDITEREIAEVADVLRSGWITTGERTKRFEREIAAYCGADRAACLNSATAALELTLRVLGIGPGDEVITSAYTYTASASVICHVGATPVLIDTAPGSYEMDYDALEHAVTPKTKAVIPVDIAGVPCDYDRIFAVAEQSKGMFSPANATAAAIGRIAVVADGAHSLGALRHGIHTGKIADFTCFSFHAVKNLTTAEGGAVVFSATDGKDTEEIYRQFMLLSLHGQSKDALAKTRLGAWEYDILSPAYKCNMTDIMAAIGLVQLERYPELLARRRAIIAAYDAVFSGTRIQPLAHHTADYTSSGHLYLTRIEGASREERDRLIEALAAHGIAANVHYKPLPMLTAYRNLGFRVEEYPNAYAQFINELTLPLHTKLTDDEVEYVTRTYRELAGL